MASFSSGVGDGGAGGVFIGSFNINSEDLTVDAARAWLKQAEGADIVALGLQVKSEEVEGRGGRGERGGRGGRGQWSRWKRNRGRSRVQRCCTLNNHNVISARNHGRAMYPLLAKVRWLMNPKLRFPPFKTITPHDPAVKSLSAVDGSLVWCIVYVAV